MNHHAPECCPIPRRSLAVDARRVRDLEFVVEYPGRRRNDILVRLGVRVLVTTHSPYLMAHLANLARGRVR